MLLRTTMLVLKLYVNMYRGVGSAVWSKSTIKSDHANAVEASN
jgi:hypothetical protein